VEEIHSIPFILFILGASRVKDLLYILVNKYCMLTTTPYLVVYLPKGVILHHLILKFPIYPISN
jgi:hypothetical protein